MTRRSVSSSMRGRSSPLMRLGSYIYGNAHDIRGAPLDALRSAREYVLMRLATLPENTTSRLRSTRKWLTRWWLLCDQELDRQWREETQN